MMPEITVSIPIGSRLSVLIVIVDGSRIGSRVAKIVTKKSGKRRKLKIVRVEANVIKVDFREKKMSEEEKRVNEYLEKNGYESVEEWALDSDCWYDDDGGIWYDEDNIEIDIHQKLWYVVDSLDDR
jgi:hypothetical protein